MARPIDNPTNLIALPVSGAGPGPLADVVIIPERAEIILVDMAAATDGAVEQGVLAVILGTQGGTSLGTNARVLCALSVSVLTAAGSNSGNKTVPMSVLVPAGTVVSAFNLGASDWSGLITIHWRRR